MVEMTWLEAIVLGIVQGLTEMLPISSSAHLRLTSALFFEEDAGASFTAVTQLGTETAVLIYFWKDIVRILVAWWKGLWNKDLRGETDYRLGWYVIIGTLPIVFFGLVFQDAIRAGARNLWLVSFSLIFFGLLLALAELVGRKTRTWDDFRLKDGLILGFAQAGALIPGVSRSGGTITAGLFIGLDRAVAARYSFLLAIPAVYGAGILSLGDVFEPATEGRADARGHDHRVHRRFRRGPLDAQVGRQAQRLHLRLVPLHPRRVRHHPARDGRTPGHLT
jgi:undecaprenyl-diphosphatase